MQVILGQVFVRGDVLRQELAGVSVAKVGYGACEAVQLVGDMVVLVTGSMPANNCGSVCLARSWRTISRPSLPSMVSVIIQKK